mmetsp:Transcript_30794/g.55091  ORF Transcript_30794/g.55091 Transcript_30794/m.55091 type:complete len:224 (-) Transcript_30794:545-1216(-)
MTVLLITRRSSCRLRRSSRPSGLCAATCRGDNVCSRLHPCIHEISRRTCMALSTCVDDPLSLGLYKHHPARCPRPESACRSSESRSEAVEHHASHDPGGLEPVDSWKRPWISQKYPHRTYHAEYPANSSWLRPGRSGSRSHRTQELQLLEDEGMGQLVAGGHPWVAVRLDRQPSLKISYGSRRGNAKDFARPRGLEELNCSHTLLAARTAEQIPWPAPGRSVR